MKPKQRRGGCLPGVIFIITLIIGISCLDTDLGWLGAICMVSCVISAGYVISNYFNPED
jgi:hypothetical protein